MTVKYSEKEYFYICLEIKKFLESHWRNPSVFVYPKGRFAFNGIYFVESTKKFVIHKDSIEDTWKIEPENGHEFDSMCISLHEAVLQICAYKL